MGEVQHSRRAGDSKRAILKAMTGRKAITIGKLKARAQQALDGALFSGNMIAYDTARAAYETVVRPGQELG